MNIIFSLAISFLGTSILSAIVLPWVLQICHKHGLYDTPNARKVHQNSIPRLGGIIFAPTAAFGTTMGVIYLTHALQLSEAFHINTLIIGLGLLAIYFIGIIDDLFGLSANIKFAVQFTSVLAFPLTNLYFNNLYGLFGISTFPDIIGYAITIFLVMFVINAMNTIDGIDGLCANFTIIALCVYCYFFYQIHNYIYCLFACAMIGTLIVYLRYNLLGNTEHGHKTFMGDSGSLMLGFILSHMGLKLSMTNELIAPPEEGILIPLTVLFIPTIDLARVAIFRIMHGQHPFNPDKTHIHHLILNLGFNQHIALAILTVADLLLILTNYVLWHSDINITWILLIDILLYSLCTTIITNWSNK